MLQISLLLELDSSTSQNVSKELICGLAQKWPNELKRLCQPMKYSSGTLHGLVNVSEEELPSSILLQNGLLLDEQGQIQIKQQYDRKAYVELNRGMSSAIALFYILRGDCYEELVAGQKKEIILSRESYLQLHQQVKILFLKNGIWNDELLDIIFYAFLFNDLGKNIELKPILHEPLKQLMVAHQEQLDAGIVDSVLMYKAILRKLEILLLVARISEETEAHCFYLESIGLADRAQYFNVKPFIYQEYGPETNISRFNQQVFLPEIVRAFNNHEKNTLFVNSESGEEDQKQEIKRVLDIRLYPTIRRLIEEKQTNIFLGSKTELQAYTKSNHEELIMQIEIPSSVKFYIAMNQSRDIKVYLSNIVSHENLIQQLITLKIADVDLQRIPILGDEQHYKSVCKEDLFKFEKQASAYLARKNVLIVAGCSLEETVCSTLEQIFNGKVTKNKFSGQQVSLTYVSSQHAPDLGFIVLNLNYGEICEEQISIILEKFNCIGIFSGSAAGYIPKDEQEELPEIGSRVAVGSAKHSLGELVVLDKQNTNLHLHVPTIFVETFDWLKNAIALGANTVDVETFYILRAVQKYQQTNPHAKIETDIGVFIADYIGKKPLRSYYNVFAQYPLVLQNFITQVLVANLTSSYTSNHSSTPSFSSQYFSIEPKFVEISQAMRREPVIDTIGTCWDKSEFYKRVHTPVPIGTVKDQENFSKEVPRCIHLPIKVPGSENKIPEEYQHLKEVLQQIFDFESSINPGWNELYAYLTVDQGLVPRSNFQRVPGPHVDGIPKDRENPEKQLIDHAYLVTDAIPTLFYTQQFDMSAYDPKMHHFFAIFRALADESRTITAPLMEILLMNAYSVHTPTQTQVDVTRTFVRLEFSTLKFDRLGNSINPHFLSHPDYPFEYVARPIPSNLYVPADVYKKKPVTNKEYDNEPIDRLGRAYLRAVYMKCDRFKSKISDYKNLSLIAEDIMNEENHGILVTREGSPQAFCLYKIENNTIMLHTLFTISNNRQELMIYQMNILKELADKHSIRAGLEEGATPITLVINENNKDMQKYFLRAARLTKIEVNLVENAILDQHNDLVKSPPSHGGSYLLKELMPLMHNRGTVAQPERKNELEKNSFGL